jgi:primosomal protein N' (replication factor Y)
MDNHEAEKVAEAMAGNLKNLTIEAGLVETEISGPVPCFFSKVNDQYRWQIIIRGPEPTLVLPARLPEGWRLEIDPPTLL